MKNVKYLVLCLDDIPRIIQSRYQSKITLKSPVYGCDGWMSMNYYYEAIQINVIESGSYTISSSGGVMYMVAYLYTDYFNPFNTSKNLFTQYTDDCDIDEFKLFGYLQSNTTYILVVATNGRNYVDTIMILVSGSSNITFNRTSKCL